METTLEWFLGAGILTVLVAQIIVIVRSIVGWFIKTGRERKGLLRLLYTEVAQNKNIIDYVSTLLDRPNDAKSALAMRGRYVTAEAWKAARLPLAQNISSKHFAVLSDYYKNLLLLEEVVTVERERKDRDASHETNSDTLDKAKILLEALVELQSEVLELIQTKVRGVTARDKYAELAQNQELPTPPELRKTTVEATRALWAIIHRLRMWVSGYIPLRKLSFREWKL